MKRSKWKVNKINNCIRSRVIDPSMINSSYELSNGNSLRVLNITKDHVGHKLGEFFPSKKVAIYKKK